MDRGVRGSAEKDGDILSVGSCDTLAKLSSAVTGHLCVHCPLWE